MYSITMSLESMYERKSAVEHILHAPDMYIGSAQSSETSNWVRQGDKIVQIQHPFVPGLYKLFDEVLVNANDQHVRKQDTPTPVSFIKCNIQDGTITVMNDGPGIDVAIHPTYGVYIPQMVFTELLTSTNYSKEKKVVGGKNGLGVKLVIIWSTYAKIETVDAVRQLKYTQVYRNNLSVIEPPVITSYKKKPYTSVTFTPDYTRFGLPGLDPSMSQLFEKRLLDIAALTGKKVKVSFNDTLLPAQTFTQYADLYIGDAPRAFEECPRWSYIVAMADEFTHVSFVNGIYTQKGGKHVEYLVNQLVRKLIAYILKKKKIEIKPTLLRERMFVILNCSIENPSFDSQTKDCLTTPPGVFGSTCEISEKFVDKVAKMGFMEAALQRVQQKEATQAKKQDGAKTKTIRGIPKYTGANRAGTVDAYKCTLILCEGDSAKASVISGLSKKDRDYYGVYPMRGKTLNVRDEAISRINENKEIHELKQIMGLEIGKVYTPEDVRAKLRYGKVLFMTDQDKDGSHIKGLGINLFGSLWKSLLQQPGFIGFMNTPIIKVKKGTKELSFYNEQQYDAWKEMNPKGWTVKYYKGLGTSTSKEFVALFQQKEQHIVHFEWKPECDDAIDRTFNKKRAEHRKEWLKGYSKDRCLNTDSKTISYTQFIDDELSHFSNYDCQRSIGNVVDGFKPSQRKILFAAFKKGLDSEIKVAQFSGYVSEHSAYHHGEASLNGAIVNMAQDYVGSNNLNLLTPNGQFGTRLEGGKDSASERYIFTQLSKYTRMIFPPEDDAILDYVLDDGMKVEPVKYVPILPMVLVNGCCGIGTGTSTNVLCYNPVQIIDYLLDRNKGIVSKPDFIPHYRGFKGKVEMVNGKCIVHGVYSAKELVVRIQELPVGTWTVDYKAFLEESIGTIIKDYTDNSTDTDVDITVKLLNPVEDLEKSLKLVRVLGTNNMNLFDPDERLCKYESVYDIIDTFYTIRHETYGKRKVYQEEVLGRTLHKLTHKVKYIRAILSDKLDLRRKTQEEIVSALKQLKIEEHEGYTYLTKMPMDSVSQENVVELEAEHARIEQSLKDLKSTTVEMLWTRELLKLRKCIESII
jgi:DNA topoisomerase-2